jgi:hypothetical protein
MRTFLTFILLVLFAIVVPIKTFAGFPSFPNVNDSDTIILKNGKKMIVNITKQEQGKIYFRKENGGFDTILIGEAKEVHYDGKRGAGQSTNIKVTLDNSAEKMSNNAFTCTMLSLLASALSFMLIFGGPISLSIILGIVLLGLLSTILSLAGFSLGLRALEKYKEQGSGKNKGLAIISVIFGSLTLLSILFSLASQAK